MPDETKDRHAFRVAVSVPKRYWERLGLLVGTKRRSEIIRALLAWYLREPGAKLPERPARQD